MVLLQILIACVNLFAPFKLRHMIFVLHGLAVLNNADYIIRFFVEAAEVVGFGECGLRGLLGLHKDLVFALSASL